MLNKRKRAAFSEDFIDIDEVVALAERDDSGQAARRHVDASFASDKGSVGGWSTHVSQSAPKRPDQNRISCKFYVDWAH